MDRYQELLAGLWDPLDPSRLPILEQMPLSDWERVIGQAVWFEVAPLLYHRLKARRNSLRIPESILRRLHAIYLINVRRGERDRKDFVAAVRALREQGIPLIILKGAHLAEWVYHSWALRPMYDIDLLVRRNNVTEAASILRMLGYAALGDPARKAEHSLVHHWQPLSKPGGSTVELHWDFVRHIGPLKQQVDFFPDRGDEVWERARTVDVDGVDALVLSPEDLLAHLCIHTAYHHTFSIKPRALCDLAEVVSQNWHEIDWQLFRDISRRWGIGRSTYLSLLLARNLMGASLPPGLLAELEPPGYDSHLELWAKERIFSEQADSSMDTLNVTRIWRANGWKARLLNLRKILLPPWEVLADLYFVSPRSPWIIVFYPVRFFSLAVKYSRFLFQVISRSPAATALMARDDRAIALGDWLSGG
jgi:hypothetical protein